MYTHNEMLRRFTFPPRPVLWYIIGLLFAFAALEAFLLHLEPFKVPNIIDLVFWSLLIVWSVRAPVQLPFKASISHLFVVGLAAVILFPPAVAPLLVALFRFIPQFGKPGYHWFQDVFNRTQSGLSVGLAALAWHQIGNSLQLSFSLNTGLGLAAASIVYFVTNLGLVSYVIHLASGASLRKVWTENFSWLSVSYLALSPVALFMSRAYEHPLIGGWGGFSVLFIMLLLYYSRFYWDEKVKLGHAFDDTIEVLVSTIDAKDPYTRLHSERVAAITSDLAKTMGFDESDQKKIIYAARIHDIGKVGIPDAILFKPAKLTPQEFDTIKSHPMRGAEVLSPMKRYLAKEVMQVVLHHHERWDGAGYPSRKKGEEIPLWARIVALSDAYEAMTAGRAYTRAKSPEEALNEIITFSGRQFDPQVVQAFEQLWMGEPTWKDREVFLRTYSSSVPSLELPSPSLPEPASATLPTSN